MYTRLLNSINIRKIFNKLQCGFRNNHAKFMDFIIIYFNLVDATDHGKCAVGIFWTFRKHSIPNHWTSLDKLDQISRQQSIMYKGHESDLMRCGVLQSSILGIFLFFCLLTHWGRDNMAAISQTTLSNSFSWMKMLEFRLKFHWNLFHRVQFTIFQHWFR